MWDRRYNMVSDMVVIEGPKAGGHLGFAKDEIENITDEQYDKEIISIIKYVKDFEEKYNKKIPVIFGGGVYDRNDIDHYMGLGADGVQMATRFVATKECDASDEFKQAYINAKKEDIMLVQSPVGMPGRAIKNDYMILRSKEKEKINHCFSCIEHCNPLETPYCITAALVRAVDGDINNSLVFCGENAYKVDKITTVKEIMDELNK